MNRRLHAYFSGDVQGVGFRFTAQRAADSLGLNGWVANRRDGRVELVCEGRDELIKDLLKKLDGVFRSYISDRDVEWSDATGEFSSFDIRYL